MFFNLTDAGKAGLLNPLGGGRLVTLGTCFAVPFIQCYLTQRYGCGSIIRAVLFNGLSPFTWLLVGICLHAVVKGHLFVWAKDGRNWSWALLRKPRWLVYACTTGILLGYTSGTVHRFSHGMNLVALANLIVNDLDAQKANDGRYSGAILRTSPVLAHVEENGVQVQVRRHNGGIFAIAQADITVFVEGERYAVVIPYEWPVSWAPGNVDAKVYLRRQHQKFWSRKKLRYQSKTWIEIAHGGHIETLDRLTKTPDCRPQTSDTDRRPLCV